MTNNERKRHWMLNNPEKAAESRERFNEKRRQRRADPEQREIENARRRELRALNPQVYKERKVYARKALTPEQQERARESRRKYMQKNYEKHRAAYKERMATDPEFAEKERARWRANNAKRLGKTGGRYANETPEQREKRLQQAREYNAKRQREQKRMRQLSSGPAPTKQSTKQSTKVTPPKQTTFTIKKKPGRLAALCGWRGY